MKLQTVAITAHHKLSRDDLIEETMKAFRFACEPEAVTGVIYFLASYESRHINGAEISVDNSSTIQKPYSENDKQSLYRNKTKICNDVVII